MDHGCIEKVINMPSPCVYWIGMTPETFHIQVLLHCFRFTLLPSRKSYNILCWLQITFHMRFCNLFPVFTADVLILHEAVLKNVSNMTRKKTIFFHNLNIRIYFFKRNVSEIFINLLILEIENLNLNASS